MTTALEGGEGSASGPGRPSPPGKTRYPLYRRLGGPQGWSGQAWKISPPTGIQYPDRPTRSQSLYRLSYPAHGQAKASLVMIVLLLIKQHHDPYKKLQHFLLNSTMLLTLTLIITE